MEKVFHLFLILSFFLWKKKKKNLESSKDEIWLLDDRLENVKVTSNGNKIEIEKKSKRKI